MMRIRIALAVACVLGASSAHADPLPPSPFTQDPIGTFSDVTAEWQDYQPATDSCVRPDVFQFLSPGPLVTAGLDNPQCLASGWAQGDSGLVKIHVETPILCPGCRRLFVDYSTIPAANSAPYFYAHGHAYFHLTSFNSGYTVEPRAHSPNIKNFTNDKLFVPDGSFYEPFVAGFDTHAISYTGNTLHTIYNSQQGPYYAGAWYLSTSGVRIRGAFLDVGPSEMGRLPGDHRLNEIGYMAGFHSGEKTCPDELSPTFADGDGYYGGCADHFGASSTPIDPFGP